MMAVDWQRMGLAVGALALAASVLAACSSPIADMPSLSSSTGIQAKPADAYTYLPVHDLPPDRDEATIPPDQRAKIQADLIAARDRQAADAVAKGQPASAAKSQPASAAKNKSAKNQSAKCGADGAPC